MGRVLSVVSQRKCVAKVFYCFSHDLICLLTLTLSGLDGMEIHCFRGFCNCSSYSVNAVGRFSPFSFLLAIYHLKPEK